MYKFEKKVLSQTFLPMLYMKELVKCKLQRNINYIFIHIIMNDRMISYLHYI
jgi:hypothetical protein